MLHHDTISTEVYNRPRNNNVDESDLMKKCAENFREYENSLTKSVNTHTYSMISDYIIFNRYQQHAILVTEAQINVELLVVIISSKTV